MGKYHRYVLVALASVAAILLPYANPIQAAPAQASWTKSSTTCNSSSSNGVINFARNMLSGNPTPAGVNYCNKTINRDSDLRTGDTYNDTFKVGNHAGGASNTWVVVNWITSSIVVYPQTCYAGGGVTVTSGGGYLATSSNPLMSYKAAASPGC